MFDAFGHVTIEVTRLQVARNDTSCPGQKRCSDPEAAIVVMTLIATDADTTTTTMITTCSATIDDEWKPSKPNPVKTPPRSKTTSAQARLLREVHGRKQNLQEAKSDSAYLSGSLGLKLMLQPKLLWDHLLTPIQFTVAASAVGLEFQAGAARVWEFEFMVLRETNLVPSGPCLLVVLATYGLLFHCSFAQARDTHRLATLQGEEGVYVGCAV